MDKKFFFVGNRFYVLKEMIIKGLHLEKIVAVEGSYLERELTKKKIDFVKISSKEELLNLISNTDFDYFLSNGCPYILPVSEIQKSHQVFLNIHPSYLPDLRGADPQPGALFFARNSGATCHIMDDEIDSGGIVSQVEIPYSQDLDAALLYQLTFMAEKQAFQIALHNKFQVDHKQIEKGNEIYYSKNNKDLIIDFACSADAIYQQIKAFSNYSQGATFFYDNKQFKVFDCELVNNGYAISCFEDRKDNEVVLNYEKKLLIKKTNALLKFKDFNQDVSFIEPGSVLG